MYSVIAYTHESLIAYTREPFISHTRTYIRMRTFWSHTRMSLWSHTRANLSYRIHARTYVCAHFDRIHARTYLYILWYELHWRYVPKDACVYAIEMCAYICMQHVRICDETLAFSKTKHTYICTQRCVRTCNEKTQKTHTYIPKDACVHAMKKKKTRMHMYPKTRAYMQ